MSYTPVNWEDSPSASTPITADNLNIMDKGIADVDARTTGIETELPKKIKNENNVIGTNHISDNAIVTSKLSDRAVTENKIASGAVTTDKLAPTSVTMTKIANEAIVTGHIVDGAIKETKIADNAITQSKISEDLLKLILAGGGSGSGITYEQVKVLMESKENTTNKVTSFDELFKDPDKFPTVMAVINYLKEYYYDYNDIDGMLADLTVPVNDSIPDYIKVEAERVATNVQSVRTGQSFTFAGFSDAHIDYSDASKTSVIHAGMGLKCIREIANVDLVAHFGDYINGSHESTKVGSIEEYKTYHKAMYEACNGVDSVWLQGNHDANYQGEDIFDFDEMYAYIGSNNTGNHTVDYGNENKLYGYIDYPTKRLRVIYLNSSDGWKTGITDDQSDWLSNTAFDLSGKSDVANWGIVIFIHIPVTFSDNAKILTAINNYSGEAEIIGIFHGHCHNFRTEKVTNKQIWQIGIPELCVGRSNEYGESSDESYSSIFGEFDSEGNPTHYNKVAETAQDTSFNIVTIDRANKKIYCHNFGAGYDRTIDYGQSSDVLVNYSITNNLTNVLTNNTATTLQSGNAYTANLTAKDGYVLDTVTVTMGGVDVTDTTYSNGQINISKVTGNVVIIATAVNTSNDDETTYTNLFSSTDADFEDAVRFNSSGGITDGSGFVTGFIPAVAGDTIYVRCPNGDYSTGTGNNIRNICIYDSSKNVISALYPGDTTIDADGAGFSYKITDTAAAYVRACGHPNGNYANFIVTKNEVIE